MKFSKELQVGIAIILAAAVFFIGIRFFQDVPILRGTYDLYTEFANTEGLTSGNAVRIQGVNVGAVEDVVLDAAAQKVRVRFHLERAVAVPEGSRALISGVPTLGSVRLELDLGPHDAPAVEPGGFIPGVQRRSMADLIDEAPELISRTDELLVQAGRSFEVAERLITTADVELAATLGSIRRVSATMEDLVRAQQIQLTATLENLQAVTSDLRGFTSTNRDSLTLAVQGLNQTFRRLDRNLSELESASASLDTVLTRVEKGDGTLGMLVNDPDLYMRLDSALTSINALIADFQQNPSRYLRELRLVDVF